MVGRPFDLAEQSTSMSIKGRETNYSYLGTMELNPTVLFLQVQCFCGPAKALFIATSSFNAAVVLASACHTELCICMLCIMKSETWAPIARFSLITMVLLMYS